MGWGQLNDGWKPAWIAAFTFLKVFLFPDLFPGDALGTPVFSLFCQVARHGISAALSFK